jgi:hypothetical protein
MLRRSQSPLGSKEGTGLSLEEMFNIIQCGLGLMSGEELQNKLNSMQRQMEAEREKFKEEQAAEWDHWLKPAEWYPEPRVVEAQFREC